MTLTYAQLKTAIQDYTDNDENTFVNNLDLFIRAAEEKILKNVQLSVFMKTTSGTMTSSNEYLAAPSDFLAPKSLRLGTAKVFLRYKTLDFIQTYTPNSATTGEPKYYALFDTDTFILAPTPDSGYAVDITYFYRPDSLTAGADAGTTWLSTNAEFALLHGSLVEAYTFMKGEADLLQYYEKLFGQDIMGLKQLGEAREVEDEYSAGPLMRPRV